MQLSIKLTKRGT